ncbi:MAG: uroporphyrinogen decarboxylase [Bacteroidetes bacterium GWE2_29_8]|nr:MAG: uroporphyrinogen decarboxylase [Bacteroidetes bacterium GWE2_29_8]OFY24511.1 MAG: uroporphyrinogen decarboxylase [Bacteroidetes bacterium GWF2_29_10]
MNNSIFIDTLKGLDCERPPIWFMRQAGRVLPSYVKLREQYSFCELMQQADLAAKVTLMPVHDLGVDAAILFSDILVVPVAMGMDLEFTDKGPVFNKPLKDLSNPADNIKEQPEKLDYIYDVIDEIIETRPDNIPLIGFCGAPLTTLCYMLQGKSSDHTFPDAIKFMYSNVKQTRKLIEKITDLSIHYALEQIKHGIDVFQLFDTHAGLLPFEMYKSLFFPSIVQMAHVIREQNVPFIYFPKGIGYGIKYITKAHCDYLSIDWHTSLPYAREIVDRNIGLQGNLDPRSLFGSKESISKMLESYIKFGQSNKNWVFNLGHGFMPETPFENARLIVDAMKK